MAHAVRPTPTGPLAWAEQEAAGAGRCPPWLLGGLGQARLGRGRSRETCGLELVLVLAVAW